MKKMMAILLCLLIALLPAQAMASTHNVLMTVTEDGPVQSGLYVSCPVGDVFYMIDSSYEYLYVHTLGEREPQIYSLDAVLGATESYDVARDLWLGSDGERLFMLRRDLDYSQEAPMAEAAMYELKTDGGVLTATKLYDVDWEFLREPGEYAYYRYIETIIPLQDYMVLCAYDDMGERVCYFMSYADGSHTEVGFESVVSSVAYGGNRLLLQQFDYEKPEEVFFQVYDHDTGLTEPLGSFEVEAYERFEGLACNTATGEVYCAKRGEIYALDVVNGTIGEAVSDLPLDMNYSSCAYVLQSNYYAYATYDGYVLRCLDKDQPEKRILRICDNGYSTAVNTAFFAFCNERSDVVAVKSYDYDASNLVDYMMSQDSTVDIYILGSGYEGFEAVFNRGYIAGMGESDLLNEAAAAIEPALLERLSVDGEFAVIPVEGYFLLSRVNPTALAKLGLSFEDVPTNWADFLDFLLQLQNMMPQDGSLSLFDPYTSDYYARYMLFDQIFNTYQLALQMDPNSVSRQEMTEMLKKLESIDFVRLGQPTEEQMWQEDFMPEWDDDGFLFTLNGGYGVQGITADGLPMVMALTPDTPAYLPMDATVAFINPYSKNKDLALAYMEMLWNELSDDMAYSLRADKTEPTPNDYYDDNVQWWEQYIGDLKVQLDEAEPADVQMLEEELEYAMSAYESAKLDVWAITEEDIEWISQHRHQLVLRGSNWLYSDDSGEAYELVEQYLQGSISAEQLMREIDNKIRMMLLEGY